MKNSQCTTEIYYFFAFLNSILLSSHNVMLFSLILCLVFLLISIISVIFVSEKNLVKRNKGAVKENLFYPVRIVYLKAGVCKF